MDELIKRHRGDCKLTGQRDFNCSCDYYAKYYDFVKRKPNQRKCLKTANRRDAEREMRKLLRNLAERENDAQRVRISEAMEWAAERADTADTAESLRCRGRMVINAIGDLYLNDLTDVELKELRDHERKRITRRGRPVAERTIQAQILALRTAVRVARKVKKIPGLPDLGALAPTLKIPTSAHGSKQTILTKAEAKKLIAYWAHRKDIQSWIILCLYTGAEKSVVPKISVDHVRDGHHFLRLPGTKNTHRDRIVPASPGLKKFLDRGLTLPVPAWDGASSYVPKSCVEIGITRATPHDLRRTFCSWMAMAGVSELQCAKLMGHGSTRMVREVYAWLTDQAKLEAVSTLPDLLDDED